MSQSARKLNGRRESKNNGVKGNNGKTRILKRSSPVWEQAEGRFPHGRRSVGEPELYFHSGSSFQQN
jgi:hypothetical protein